MRFEARTTDNGKRAFDELVKSVGDVDGAYVDIGLHDDGATEEGGEYLLAEIGAVHEFGTKPGTVPAIPERSWLRSTSDERQERWGQRSDRALRKIEDGGDPLQELTAVGELCASDVKRKITTLREPPNAPSTIARKGSSNPLIDTGTMRANVRSRVVVPGKGEAWTPKGPS